MVCFALPPGSASALRALQGFASHAESKRGLQCWQPGAGTKDAPRTFPLKLRTITRGFGLKPTSYDEDFRTCPDLLTAEHADDTNMAGVEDAIDKTSSS
eukprot:5836575-Pyramimonas_sp.AAC.1